MKRDNATMLEGPLLRSMIGYTIPIILTSVLQLLFNAADLVVVGKYCGSISVGAVGATNAVTNLIVNLFVGLSVGAGVSVAHAIGGRRDEETSNTVHTAIPLAVVGGVFLTIVGICLAEPLLILMDTPENVLPLSAMYMRIYFAGMTFSTVYNFSAAILRAAGDTRSPLIYLCISGVLNVVLNVIFVHSFDMNVAGVALATIISQCLSAILCVRKLMHRQDACHLDLKQIRFHKVQLLKMIRIGIPAGIQGSLFSISNVIIQSAVNSFGDVFISGNSAAASIEGFLYASLNAFHQTAVNFVGQNVGARQYHRARRVGWVSFGCVTVVGLVLGSILYALGPELLSIYIVDSQEAIADGMIRMSYMCIPYFLLGLMDVSTGILRGYGASVAPMIISILGVCGVRIGWIYTIFQIPAYHTPQWLYISYPVSWLLTFVIQLTFLLVLLRRFRKMEQKESLEVG